MVRVRVLYHIFPLPQAQPRTYVSIWVCAPVRPLRSMRDAPGRLGLELEESLTLGASAFLCWVVLLPLLSSNSELPGNPGICITDEK